MTTDFKVGSMVTVDQEGVPWVKDGDVFKVVPEPKNRPGRGDYLVFVHFVGPIELARPQTRNRVATGVDPRYVRKLA
jgi:hypothetical protein